MKNEKITVDKACEWVENRLGYGRYRASSENPFVYDECCQAGDLAVKSMRAIEYLQQDLQNKINSDYFIFKHGIDIAQEILDLINNRLMQ